MSEPTETGEPDALAADGNGNAARVLSPTDSTQVALSRMIQFDVTRLPVVDGGTVVGEVTKDTVYDIAQTGA